MTPSAAPSRLLAGALVLALLTVFFYAMFRFSIGLILPGVLAEFALDSVQGGVFLSISLAATTGTTGVAGYLADRIGPTRILLLGLVVYSAGLILAFQALEYLPFVVFLAVNGLGAGLMLTPLYPLIGALVPRRRGLGISSISALYNFGGFVGPAYAAAFLGLWGWRLPFVSMGIVGLVLAGAQWRFLRAPNRTVVSQERPQSVWELITRNRNLAVLAVGMFFADLGFLAFISWAPTFLRHTLGMSAELAGLLFGLAIALGGVGVLTTGALYDRVGGKRVVVGVGVASAGLTLAFALQPSASIIAVVLLLAAGFVTNSFWNLLSALAQTVVGRERVGTATGVVQNVAFLGAIVGPTLVGAMEASLGLGLALVAGVSIPYALFTITMLGYRPTRQPSP